MSEAENRETQNRETQNGETENAGSDHQQDLEYYREQYRLERMKSARLADRLADESRKAEDLQIRLDRIR